MSLRFYFGPSGAGKSRQLYTEIIRRSMADPGRNFLIIVPDQFTMQTQKDIVTLHEREGIMNIDVLSFGRLSHRIFEEVGGVRTPVLDDVGKSLVIQKVAAGLKDQLPALGSHLSKQGYIHEVKSAVSEFMQYGIGTEDVGRLIEFAEKRGALVHKLKDLQTLYRGFVEYILGHFVTTEETMDVLRKCLPKSRLIPGSVVVFDGFTGFTPIQGRLIQEIMTLAGETIVTITLGAGENPYIMDGEQKLFYLSKKTVNNLEKLAREAAVAREADVFLVSAASDQEALTKQIIWTRPGKGGVKEEIIGEIRYNPNHRFTKSPSLLILERNLFRYQVLPYEQAGDSIRIFECGTPKEEVRQIGQRLLGLICKKGIAYRDAAIITGDLESYAPHVEMEFAEMGIPFFIDRTRKIVLNPLTEYIKSAILLFRRDFTYEAVFHYLRSGLADIPDREIDELENYVIRTGIRGRRRWTRVFAHKTTQLKDKEEKLAAINNTREKMLEQLAPLTFEQKGKVSEYVERLYEFLVANKVQQKLLRLENMFTERNQPAKAKEYAQIYRLVMELLNQIHQLLGEEEITLDEFADILESGFGEIEVGTIPQNVDRVVVGDMERTRLKEVKVLFFLGVNDGNIPKNASTGGIISDIDREFLKESELELAPSPRQQMFIQRLYLYLNMTKPSEALYLSYAKVNSAGKALRPAYLIDVVGKLFPGIRTEHPQNRPVLSQIVSPGEGLGYLAEGLRSYVERGGKEDSSFFTLYHAYGKQDAYLEKRTMLTRAAFERYEESGLSKAVAQALYGVKLENSVTRLETYAQCAFRHFLQYGLSLKEREEFGFEPVDMGNVFHEVLQRFAQGLEESEYTWFDFPAEYGEAAVKKSLEELAARYGDTILYSSARNEYAITRMGRVLTRTVTTLQSQLKKGEFRPDAYELSFQYAEALSSINVSLSAEEKMRLTGRIDRIDVAEEEDKIYVKVIDYKSGSKHFDLAALYYGLQLQLVVYMNAAMEVEANKHPDKEIIPAALLYYHIEDPTIETSVELTEAQIQEELFKQLRMHGVVNAGEGIAEKLDGSMADKSDVIPVERKKDGSFSSRSSVLDGDELKIVSDYVNHKVRSIGREILDGKISMNPYEKGTAQACTYCEYRKVCGFDPAIPGYGMRSLDDMDKKAALEEMQKSTNQEKLDYGN